MRAAQLFPYGEAVIDVLIILQNPVAVDQSNESLCRIISAESDLEPPKSFQDTAAAGSLSTYPMDKETKAQVTHLLLASCLRV